MKKNKTCIQCKELFPPKKSKQKFCSDDCRYTHNNWKKRNKIGSLDLFIDSIQTDLDIIDKITSTLGFGLIERSVFEKAGFSFNFYGFFTRHNNYCYHIIGPYGYRIEGNHVRTRLIEHGDPIFTMQNVKLD